MTSLLLCGWRVNWHLSPGSTLRWCVFWEVTTEGSHALLSVLMKKSCCQEGKIRYLVHSISITEKKKKMEESVLSHKIYYHNLFQ